MPEHLRALVFILFLATVVFAFAKAPACAQACAPGDFARRRNLWFALTLTAFLAHSFWLFTAIAAVTLLAVQRREQNKLAMYFMVLFAVPAITVGISGAGVVKALFEMHYVRLLALTVLLPAYLYLRRQPDVAQFGRLLPDKLLLSYLVLSLLLLFEHRTLTSILRDGVFYAFTDVFLPYYVASRCLRTLQDFRDALMSLVIAVMVLSATLFLEFWGRWLLYSSLEQALGAPWGWNNYLVRGANIRASGSIGHAISAGYVVAVGFGLYLYVKNLVPKRTMWLLGLALLIAGLIGPVSRGPWVGAALMVVVFLLTGPAPMLSLMRLGLLGAFALPILLLTPAGGTIIDHLPFVGTVDERNVLGRKILAEVSLQVFMENPIFGRHDFVETPAMQALKGDDGNVDLVNTYVVVVLGSGLVGLSLFVGFFISVILGILGGLRRNTGADGEQRVIGRVSLAVLLGVLLIIGTVSPVLLVPTIFWCVGGLGVAYAQLVTRVQAPAGLSSPVPARAGPPGMRGATPT